MYNSIAINLQQLPREIVVQIFEQLVLNIGLFKSMRFRLINKYFDSFIMYTICDSQVVDIDDPATTEMSRCMPPALKAKIMLNKSISLQNTSKSDPNVLNIIHIVNKALDNLIGDSFADSDSSLGIKQKRHLRIAKAFSHHGWRNRNNIDAIRIVQDPNVQNHSTLCGAIILGDLSLVKLLMQRQPSLTISTIVNTESLYFGFPLHLAAAWEHIEIVRYLLECGSSPYAISEDAAPNGNMERYLGDVRGHYMGTSYRHQADRSTTGSALRVAVLAGNDNITRLLLDSKYRISTKILEYYRVMGAIARFAHLDILEELISHTGEKSLIDYSWFSEELLRRAAYYKQYEFVKLSLRRGTNINAYHRIFDPSCKPVTHITMSLSTACRQGDLKLAHILLDAGANVKYAHHIDRTNRKDPLRLAASHGHEDVVKLLLDRGCYPETALVVAAAHGQAHLVKWLCHSYPDLIKTTGRSALVEAAAIENWNVVSALFDAGLCLEENPVTRDQLRYIKASPGSNATKLVQVLGAEFFQDVETHIRFYGETNRGKVEVTDRTWEWVGKY